jgi:hypothetical protein
VVSKEEQLEVRTFDSDGFVTVEYNSGSGSVVLARLDDKPQL